MLVGGVAALVLGFVLHTPASTFQSRVAAPVVMGRKPGVSSPEELAAFVAAAGDALVVVDVRNTDFAVEPGDEKTHAKAPIGDPARKAAVNIAYDRNANSMDLTLLAQTDKAAPIITHCGGGGRGQKGKDFLMANGFTNVMNGGGPEDDECWAVFGGK